MTETRIIDTPDEVIRSVLAWWNLDLARVRPDIDLEGSPERTEYRVAVEDSTGALYVLERIHEHRVDHRRRISSVLLELQRRGLHALHPYLRNRREGSISTCEGGHWQLMPYVPGEPLPRPEYAFDAWRGNVLGTFLAALRRRSDDLPMVRGDVFSIQTYVTNLCGRLRRTRADLMPRMQPYLDLLHDGLFRIHDDLPVAFVHGDVHPLNIIWGRHCLNSVLDWEFMGFKPELYDIANLIGCVGMDLPEALLDELVAHLTGTLRREGIAAEVSWHWLPDYILALRFGWMREWLHRGEEDMVDLELAYMEILASNLDKLRTRFTADASAPAAVPQPPGDNS